MTIPETEAIDWSVRALVYRHVVDSGQPPTVAEVSAAMGIEREKIRAAFRRLHERRALFLAADGDTIRMANPFSGVPTPFRVHAGGQAYWANCMWDALGIGAALRSDATITTEYAEDNAPTQITVSGGRVNGHGVVHFLVPFRRWYEDLIHT